MATKLRNFFAGLTLLLAALIGMAYAGESKEPPTLLDAVIAKEAELQQSGAKLSDLWVAQRARLALVAELKSDFAQKKLSQEDYNKAFLTISEELYAIDRRLNDELLVFSKLHKEYLDLINQIVSSLVDELNAKDKAPGAH